MKTVFRLVLLAGVLALGVWLWTIIFPSAEKLVRQKIASLASTVTFDANDSNISRAVKVGNLISYFTVDAEISIDAPELGAHTLSGRDEIRDTGRAVFATLSTLNVEFLDVTVHIGADKQTADVNCTARVNVGNKKDYGVQEVHFHLKKVDGTWLISRAETLKTLS